MEIQARRPVMQDYLLVLSTYNLRQTVKIQLWPKEVELLNDIKYSLESQKASIMLEPEKDEG